MYWFLYDNGLRHEGVKKIYTTNFVQSQFWWIVDRRFNGIRHIFIPNFVLVVYGVN